MKLDKQVLIKRIPVTLLISALLPLVLTLSVPFEIYANNFNEFNFSLMDFFGVGIGFFFLFMAIIFFAIFFLPKKAYKIVCGIIISLAFLMFIQGNYLNGKINALKGDGVGETSASTVSVVFNAILWVAVIAISVVLACLKDKKGIISIIGVVVSIIVLVTQIITPVSLSISKKDMFVSANERVKLQDKNSEHYVLSTKNLNTISKSSNIYWFCIDRFDEYFAEQAYKENPKIYENLTGFTWFQDNISNFGHTYPAVANMLTNNDYNSELRREDFLNSIYNENQTLEVLNENGYNINLYTCTFEAYTDAYRLPSYVKNREKAESFKIKDRTGLLFSIVNMSLYRCFPLVAKGMFSVSSSTSNSYVVEANKDGKAAYSLHEKDYKRQFINAKYSLTDEKQFSFIHTDGCHAAFSVKDSAWYVEKNINFVNKYIEELKKNNLYKDATIIVTGDHGLRSVDDSGPLTGVDLTALFVKPAGVGDGELKISKAQTSHKNLWATIMKSEGIETEIDYGKSVFEIPEGEDQERTFIWHTYSYAFAEYHYKIVGNGKDFNNWTKTSEKHFDRHLTD